MKSGLITLIAILIIFLASPSISFSLQDSTNVEVHRVELKDGSVVIGTILSENSVSIKFRTMSNVEMVIQKEQIIKIEVISGKIVKGEIWGRDPNHTRLLFAPTARALKAGQGYFSDYDVSFLFVAVGITDFFTLAGGMTLFRWADEQLYYIAPKITPIHVKNFDLAAGVLYGKIPVLIVKIPDKEEGAGIVYGVGTYGTEEAALTFGIGFGFAGGEFAGKPIFALGGEYRISKSIKLITENWLIPDSEVQLLSVGIRFFGRSLAADFGLIYPAGREAEGFPFLPWVGFAYNFGSKK